MSLLKMPQKHKNLKFKTDEDLNQQTSISLKAEGSVYCLCDGDCPKIKFEDDDNICASATKIKDIYDAQPNDYRVASVVTPLKKLSFDITKLKTNWIYIYLSEKGSKIKIETCQYLAEYYDEDEPWLMGSSWAESEVDEDKEDDPNLRVIWMTGIDADVEVKVPSEEFYLFISGTLSGKTVKHKFALTLDFKKEVTLKFEAEDEDGGDLKPIKDYTFDPKIKYKGKIKNASDFGNALTKVSSLGVGAIIGIVVVGVVVIGAVVAVVIIVIKKKKQVSPSG